MRIFKVPWECRAVDDKPVLLWVEEMGGYPDFTALYQTLGYQVVRVRGVRKALTTLKRLDPQVVVAEFNYAPTYGSRISTVEPLLARLQSHHPMTRILLFAEPDRLGHLETLSPAYGKPSVLTYPLQVGQLERLLDRV
jgi:hypothetical protein